MDYTRNFSKDQIVRVISEENLFEKLQNESGGYSKIKMHGLLGQYVQIMHISSKCVRVNSNGIEHSIHPKALISDKFGSLIKTIMDDNVEEFRALMQSENNMERYLRCQDYNGDCLGHISVNKKRKKMLTEMFDIYPKIIEILNIRKQSILHVAVNAPNVEIIRFLIKKGASTMIKDCYGKTPLDYVGGKVKIGDIIKEEMKNRECEVKIEEKSAEIPHRDFQTKEELPSEKFTTIDPVSFKFHEQSVKSNQLSNIYDTIDPPSFKEEQTATSEHPTFETRPSIPISTISPFQKEYSLADCKAILEDPTPHSENECTICYTAIKDTAFRDCGHTSCYNCAKRLFQCHICGKEISERIRIYI